MVWVQFPTGIGNFVFANISGQFLGSIHLPIQRIVSPGINRLQRQPTQLSSSSA